MQAVATGARRQNWAARDQRDFVHAIIAALLDPLRRHAQSVGPSPCPIAQPDTLPQREQEIQRKVRQSCVDAATRVAVIGDRTSAPSLLGPPWENASLRAE
jgi:hypothetical protein